MFATKNSTILGRFFLCIALCLCCCASASAATITAPGLYKGVNVGAQDQLVASAALANSGLDTEEAWIRSVLEPLPGGIWKIQEKIEQNDVASFATNVAKVYAIALPAPTEYFFIKTGKVKSGFDHFLYKNLGDLNWGVVSLADWGSNANIGKVSHVCTVVDPPAPHHAPEPSTALLLGVGLLGLGALGRRRN